MIYYRKISMADSRENQIYELVNQKKKETGRENDWNS